jgi:hypothetical protein
VIDVTKSVTEHGAPIAVGNIKWYLKAFSLPRGSLFIREVSSVHVDAEEVGNGPRSAQENPVADVYVGRTPALNPGLGGIEDLSQEGHSSLWAHRRTAEA